MADEEEELHKDENDLAVLSNIDEVAAMVADAKLRRAEEEEVEHMLFAFLKRRQGAGSSESPWNKIQELAERLIHVTAHCSMMQKKYSWLQQELGKARNELEGQRSEKNSGGAVHLPGAKRAGSHESEKSLEALVSERNSTIQALRVELEESQASCENLKKHHSRLENDVQRLASENDGLRFELGKWKKSTGEKIQGLANELKAARFNAESVESERQSLQQKMGSKEAHEEHLLRDRRSLRSKCALLERQLEALRHASELADKKLESKAAALLGVELKLQQLTCDHEATKKRFEELRNQYKKTEERKELLENARVSASKEHDETVAALSEKLEAAAKRELQLKRGLYESRDRIEKLEKDSDEAKQMSEAKVQSLEENVRDLLSKLHASVEMKREHAVSQLNERQVELSALDDEEEEGRVSGHENVLSSKANSLRSQIADSCRDTGIVISPCVHSPPGHAHVGARAGRASPYCGLQSQKVRRLGEKKPPQRRSRSEFPAI